MDELHAFVDLLLDNRFVITTLCAVSIFITLTAITGLLHKRTSPFAPLSHFTRNIIFPTGVLVISIAWARGSGPDLKFIKILQTILGIEIVWLFVSFIKILFFVRPETASLRDAVPGLVIDITRVTLLFIGSGIVVAAIWNKDLSTLITTLGIGSVVIGLALQETLGNLFSGIALFFEKPFRIGEWIRVGDSVGEVIESTWRSVHIRTRENTLIVVPNSVLTKERIQNFSKPTRPHRVVLSVGFSYNDPPEGVKNIIAEVLKATPNVLSIPKPDVITKSYGDFSISYEMRFYIDDFAICPEVEDTVMSRVWYVARREGLSIPFPIRTVYKTEVPYEQTPDYKEHIREALSEVSIFKGIPEPEFISMLDSIVEKRYAAGERVLRQGDAGDAFYIISTGIVMIRFEDSAGIQHDIRTLGPKEFFGERALFTGELRSSHVYAITDIDLLVIYKDTFHKLLEIKPSLTEEIAEMITSRSQEIDVVREQVRISAETTTPEKADLLNRIRMFFRVN